MCVARNVAKDPRLVPGGGAVEMAVSHALTAKAAEVEGIEAGPYRAVATALEVIPRTLAQNCGANVIRTLTKLRAQHAEQAHCTVGIDGNSGACRPSCLCIQLPACSAAGHVLGRCHCSSFPRCLPLGKHWCATHSMLHCTGSVEPGIIMQHNVGPAELGVTTGMSVLSRKDAD